jgi:hypothetical protein
LSEKPGRLAVAFMVTAVALTSCSGGGIGQNLAPPLEECSSALASAELSVGQVLDDRSTTAASLVVAEDMRDEISKARDQAVTLKADGPDEQKQRAESLAQMDQALAAALEAYDAVAAHDQQALQDASRHLQQLSQDIKQHAEALKAGS